ncbi:vacuolar H[+] ATPase AC45 accessory subunit [Anticarsia gemmatalis]|uniref:vacuolar H[+] ATPase AC45 accessory subunit n=1 Tax=Anticarsia gemmatalis TaxID=129554 RepID=UPI003F76C1F3
MAFCRLVFPLLVLSVVSCYGYESKVPVYIWGDLPYTSQKSNPLETLPSSEFLDIVQKELADRPLTVVFVENSLSVEDFSLKNGDGKTSYPYLQANIGKSIYLPSVREAVSVLEDIAGPNPSRITKIEDGLTEELPGKALETDFIFITLEDAKDGESRAELLKRHDDFMKVTVAQMKEHHDKVVAIYSSKYPSWIIPTTESHSRKRRAVAISENNTLDGLRLYSKAISVKTDNESLPLTSMVSSSSQFAEMSMNTTLGFENDTSITLNFVKNGYGYWYFSNVVLSLPQLTETLRPTGEEPVYALEGFAYRCAQYVSFTSVNESKTYTVTFEDLKVQPYFSVTNGTPAWGDSFNCVGFFTAPIWAGLFVVFILLSITFYGIMMMLDIRTMDRFDDPKGKTITINAGE